MTLGQELAGDPDENNYEPDPDDELIESAPGELADTDYSPPDHDPGIFRFGVTAQEEREGEPLTDRLAEELPDVGVDARRDPAASGAPAGDDEWELEPGREDAADVTADLPPQAFAAARRAGRLVAPNRGFGPDTEPELIAADDGMAGFGASAEEAAMHIVDADDPLD